MTDGFIRQRRNIFIASTVVVFLRFGGVSVEKVSLLGTELHFDNIQALYAAVWVFFIYAFIRYYQYYQQENNKGISSVFWGKMNALCVFKLRNRAVFEFPSCEKYGGDFQFSELKRVGIFKREGGVIVDQDESGKIFSEKYEVNILSFTREYFLSFVHLNINASPVTDYILPFIFAVFSFAYGVSGEWQGSLVSIISAF